MRTPAAFLLLCGLLLSALPGTPETALPGSRPVLLLYTVAREYSPTAWMQAGERFPRGATLFLKDAAGRRPLVAALAATADATVSFDGRNVLFAGKRRPSDRWQIWEVAVRTGRLRQVTRCREDCVRPLYVPSDRFVYAHKVAGKFLLEIADLQGNQGKALQLTPGPGNFLPTDVLRDGRVLFEATYPVGDDGPAELYTVYTDGSGVEAYRCDHGHPRHSGKQLSSGDIVFAREGSLYRFTSALAHEVAVPAPPGIYAGAVNETPEGAWLVSWRAAGQDHFELRSWTPGATVLRPEVAVRGADVVQPVLLLGRSIPNLHPSALHEWSYANVLCLNAYTSPYSFPEGSIASVRLYTRDLQGSPELLGAARVEKDGSFYLRLPGDQPLQIELLDGSGATLKKEAGWFWLRAGEQRVCVGCHAGPQTAPENAAPEALLRSTIPADLTGSQPRRTAGGR